MSDTAGLTPAVEDAYSKLDRIQRENTLEVPVREDISVVALAHQRAVQLSVARIDYSVSKGEKGRESWRSTGPRNVATMRETAVALLEACDFVEDNNPTWAAHPGGNHGPRRPDLEQLTRYVEAMIGPFDLTFDPGNEIGGPWECRPHDRKVLGRTAGGGRMLAMCGDTAEAALRSTVRQAVLSVPTR